MSRWSFDEAMNSDDTQGTLTFQEPLNKHQRQWWEFKAKNPKVYALFVRFAQALLQRQRRFGIGQLAERVRWEIRTTWEPDEDGFKLNNNWRAYIARDLIHDMPELEPLLELRRVREGDDEEDDA